MAEPQSSLMAGLIAFSPDSHQLFTPLILGIFSTYGYLQQKRQLESNFQAVVDGAVYRMKLSLAESLWQYDEEITERIVRSEMRAQGVNGVFVWSRDKLFHGAVKDEAGTVTHADAIPDGFGDSLEYALEYDNSEREKTVGRLELYTDRSQVDAALRAWVTQKVFEIIALDMVIFLSLSWMLSFTVLKRLRRVTTAVKDIAEGDLTRRINESSQDELGACPRIGTVAREVHACPEKVLLHP
ncbi:MAG: HAMP domain-containing protein [Sedimenticola sp.]